MSFQQGCGTQMKKETEEPGSFKKAWDTAELKAEQKTAEYYRDLACKLEERVKWCEETISKNVRELDCYRQEHAEIENTLEAAEVFPMDPAESLSDHIEHIINYVHRLEEKLEDSATTMMMVRALVRDSEEL